MDGKHELFKVRHIESGSVYTVYEIKVGANEITFFMYFNREWQYMDSKLFKEYRFEDWQDYVDNQKIIPTDLSDDDVRAVMKNFNIQ